MKVGLKLVGAYFALNLVAACTPQPAKIPPPPVRTAPPVKPTPPLGAATSYNVPPIGADGVRVTPNRGISSNEAVWHFRSAINVAALNCRGPVLDSIAPNYNKFLSNNKLTLRKISRNIDAEYRTKYPGQNPLRVRDTKLTDIYNYFSLPAVKREFCDTALIKSQEAAAVSYKILPEFTAKALADIDAIFIRFFDSYAQYENELAIWNQQYGGQQNL